MYIIDKVIVLSDLVESSGYSSKTLQKGSCPHAPLDEVLRYHCFKDKFRTDKGQGEECQTLERLSSYKKETVIWNYCDNFNPLNTIGIWMLSNSIRVYEALYVGG